MPAKFLVSSIFFITSIASLIGSFFFKKNNRVKFLFLLSISILFLVNVIMIDYLYIRNTITSFNLLNIGKYPITFTFEPIGIIFLTIIAVSWPLSLLYTIKFISINNLKKSSIYLFFINCSILLGCMLALSGNLITMFILYELLTLFTIPLITHYYDKKTFKGLYKYLTILLLSSVTLFLPAIIAIHTKTDGTFVNGGFIKYHFSDSHAVFLLLLFIFGISKAALYPLNSWLTAVMVASYPVSALLHAVITVKSGLLCIYKILLYVFGLDYLQHLFIGYNWLVIFPTITIAHSSVKALKCNNIKMLLAYSTINHLSVSLISAFLFTHKGLKASVMHMVSHAVSKISLFYSAGNFYSLKKTYCLDDLKGIHSVMPLTSIAFVLASLSLIGIPPLAGFISKFYILLAAVSQENFLVVVVIMVSSVFSSFYMLRVVNYIYLPIKVNLPIKKKLPINMGVSLFLCILMVSLFFFVQVVINIFLNLIYK